MKTLDRWMLWIGVIVAVALVASGCATTSKQATSTRDATPTPAPTPTETAAPTPTPAVEIDGLVLNWVREGGIAGFCDAVAVYGDGQVEVSWCRGNELRELKSLSAEQRAQLLAWIETYAPYEFDHRDPAVADSMRVRLTFAGRGGQEISDAERRAMLAWVGALVPPRSSEAFPPQVVESATSRPAPAGLVYRAEEALWSVDANGQQRTLTRYGDALPAPDLARALHWDGEALWVIDLRTGTREQIETAPLVVLGGGSFQWADADTVLLGVLKSSSEEGASLGHLAVLDISSGELTLLDPENVSLSLPAASPDGQTIAYDALGVPRLVRTAGDPPPFEPQRFEGLPASDFYSFSSPAWSPDGRKLAWRVGGTWGAAILVFDLEAYTVQMLHSFQPLGTGAAVPAPAWSPDGRWLALTIRSSDIEGTGTWLLAVGGSVERRLSGSTLADPIWTGDGQLIWNDYDEQAGTPNVIRLLDLNVWMQHTLDLPIGGMAIGWFAPGASEMTKETVVRYVLALRDVPMYGGPGTNHEVIGSVFDGQVAWVTGQSADGAWWRVICPDDTVGDCWLSASPEWTEPTTPPGAWPVYMLASGVSVEYPLGWLPSPGGYDGTQESVWFVSPDEDPQQVAVEVHHRPVSEQAVADPYTWQPNEGGYEVHWARPVSTVGGLSGLEFVWGAYSKSQEQWDTPPSMMALFYSPEHELDVRLTTSFDRPTLELLQTAGFTETVAARFGTLRRMAQSIRAHPTTGWETYRDTEADGLFELKHPPDWAVRGEAIECGVAYDLGSLKLLVFEGCWVDAVDGQRLTFFDTMQRVRSAFTGELAASRRAVNGMQVEVVHYGAAGDNGIVSLDPGPGTVALWTVGEQGYALIDARNQHQGDGAFDGVLGSFLLLPPMPRGEPHPLEGQSVQGGTAFALPGVNTTVVLPAGYGVATNNEYNRRGSLVSFDFTPYGGDTPRLAEIQFFSEASINTFTERCAASGGFCFEGDYPDLERYQAQKTALAQCANLAAYETKQFGGRCYLVADHRCTGDACVLREYTTFADETMVSVLIMMRDPSQAGASDELFALFSLPSR